MTAAPPQTILPGNQIDPQLATRLKAAISGYVAQSVRPVNDVGKVYWNGKLRRNKLYYEGKQNLAYGWGVNGFADYVNVSGQSSMGIRPNVNNQEWVSDYVLNFFQGDVDTFIAVIGSRAPNCQSQAKDPSNDAHVRLKMKADRVSQWLDSSWNIELMHPLLTKGIALFGTMFGYTRYTINERRYGNTPQQSFQIQNTPAPDSFAYYQCWYCGTQTQADQAQSLLIQTPDMPPGMVPCSNCGRPLGMESLVQPDTIPSLVPNEIAPLANGAVELSIYNSSHITTDLDKKDLDYASFLLSESEEDKGALVQAYPELRSKIYQDNYVLGKDEMNAMGAYTRALLTSPTGQVVDQKKNRWLHSLLWISPTSFEYLPNDRSGEIRERMLEKYPDGVKVPMVNGETLINRMEDERLTSVWVSCAPKPSETIYADAYFECMIQIQDGINDADEMANQQMQRSNPFIIGDPEILNPEMIKNSVSNNPGQFIFAKPGSVGTLDKGFFRMAGAELNPVLFNYITQKLAWCREITGMRPEIAGGDSGGGEKTAREVEIRRNQAMQKLQTPWNQLRMFWAAVKGNGIYQAAKYSGSKLFARNPRGNVESMEIDGIWELLQGGWYIRCEESTPMSIGARRDFVMGLLDKSPEAQAGLGMKDPENAVKFQEAIGMADWRVPGYDENIALHEIINQLVKGQPLPGAPGPVDPITGMPGPPGPPQPSIPFDPFLFDANFAMQVVKTWLLKKGQQVQMDNPAGYQNVLAYGHSASEQVPPDKPEQKGPTMAVAVDFSGLTPDAQQAFAHQFGIQAPPGQLALPPAPKAALGPGGPPPDGGPHPGPLPPSGAQEPPNDLVGPPPGMMPPQQADLAGPPPS